MTISYANKLAATGSTWTGSTGTVTTSTFASTTGNYYLLMIAGATVTGTPTMTGTTFALLVSSGTNFVYGGYCTSGTTAAVSFTWSGSNPTIAQCCDEVSGLTAASPVLQKKMTAGTTSSLSSLIQASNSTYSINFLSLSSFGTVTPPTSYTTVATKGGAAGGIGFQSAAVVPGVAAAAWTDAGGAASNFVATFEIGDPLASFGTAPAVNSMMLMGMGV